MRHFLILGCVLTLTLQGFAQHYPAPGAQIEFLATYGNMSAGNCGDDDFSQTIFIVVPESQENSFFIRIFDPDCGGKNDLSSGWWETDTKFEVYGGDGCFSAPDARSISPDGDYKSGTLLAKGLFAYEPILDNKWVSFGPFNVQQGEKITDHPGRFFKLIVEGCTGNDGNLYSLYISQLENENLAVSGSSVFQYEYTFNIKSVENDRSIPDQVTKAMESFAIVNFGINGDPEISGNTVTVSLMPLFSENPQNIVLPVILPGTLPGRDYSLIAEPIDE